MKPKGWRLDPAWVEHYSKIEQERIEREMERVKFAVQIEMDKIKMQIARADNGTPVGRQFKQYG